MKSISPLVFLIPLAILIVSCRQPATAENAPAALPTPTAEPAAIERRFAYPVGPGAALTEARDRRDDWYNALDFRADDHLGEDWNLNSGGNSDCGESVYAIGAGRVVYAGHAGAGWGWTIIIEHRLADGRRIESLYAHLEKIEALGRTVERRQKVGTVGSADGRYLCHLHFEIRTPESIEWNRVGPGYAPRADGWLDPSDFIDRNRSAAKQVVENERKDRKN